MKFSHYVNLLAFQTDFNDSENREPFATQLYIDRTNDLAGNFSTEDLNTLLTLDVMAHLEAQVSPGKFPVILVPYGDGPASQSITCEYLASFGYLVAGFVPKGRFSSELEVSTTGLETAVDDLEFVLGKISELPHADMQNVAFMANAIRSSVCAAAAARNQKIKALISLEGGFPSAFEQRLLSGSVFYEPENLKLPMLFIYAPHPSIQPKYIRHLKYSQRYFAHFPYMSEFLMLNYGMFNTFVPDIIGEHKGNTQKGYEMSNELMLRFLNKYLKKEERDIFDDEFIAASQEVIDTTFVWPGLPYPPSLALMKDHYVKKGFSVIDSTYQTHKQSGNAHPFSQSFYTTFGMWLGWGHDPDFTSRLKLYELAYDSYHQSARVNYYLAYYLEKIEQKNRAVEHYRKAVALLPTGDDERLNKNESERIRSWSEQALLDLQ